MKIFQDRSSVLDAHKMIEGFHAKLNDTMMVHSILILTNMISTKYIAVPLSLITISLEVYVDINVHQRLNQEIDQNEILKQTAFGLQNLLALLFISLMLNTAEIELIKAWNLKEMMHRELADILDNLETGIITKTHGRIGLCNDPGTNILHSI
jgi:hypothetical protein